jgi:predicted flap endonuclease-1-like 5' DNA nuclease
MRLPKVAHEIAASQSRSIHRISNRRQSSAFGKRGKEMTYLLAKYALLFLLTAALGFLLGYWWSRRNFVDVTEAYEDLRKVADRSDTPNWQELWRRMDALPEPKDTDLSRVYERLDGVASALGSLPKPEPTDLGTLEDGLESLQQQVSALPVPLPPKDPDFRPIFERIEKLEGDIRAIPAPADLVPVTTRLGSLEDVVRSIPKPAPQKDIDLQPVTRELASIRNDIRELPKVETQEPVDLAPITRQLGSLEKHVNGIARPEIVNLRPIDSRLEAIEKKIGKFGEKLAQPASKAPRSRAKPKPVRKEPRILSAALYGKKDDLKQISGVGPKLERLLNKNGVFYFWQVASWSRSDIDVIDDRLDVFKGRISRDNWVPQAKQLKRSPDAARMPAD